MKRPGIWITTALLGGFVLGGVTYHGDETKVDFIEVPKTEVIHSPAEVKEVPVLPDACQRSIELADDITRAAEEIYRSGEEQIRIIQDGRLTLAAQGYMGEIETRQRRLHGTTVGALNDLEAAFARYDTASKECEKNDE